MCWSAKTPGTCYFTGKFRSWLAQGIEVDRSVLTFRVGYAGAELMPLWWSLREILLNSPRLFIDESRARVLDPGRDRTKSGYFWSIARDDHAWCGETGPPAVVYTNAPASCSATAMPPTGR
jgi:transposase